MSMHPNGNGEDDPRLEAMARVAAEAANGAANAAVSPVYEIAARAARAAEHAGQIAGIGVEEGRKLGSAFRRFRLQSEASFKGISADVADLKAVVLIATARDAAQDQEIFAARQAADQARREAIVAQERVEVTGQISVTEIRGRQQSDAQIVTRLQEATLKTIETHAGISTEERRLSYRARLRIIVAVALTLNAALALLLTLALKGYFR